MLSIILNNNETKELELIEKLNCTLKYLFQIHNHQFMSNFFKIKTFNIFIKDDFNLIELDKYLDSVFTSREFTLDERMYYRKHKQSITINFEHVSFQGRRKNILKQSVAYFQNEIMKELNKKYCSNEEKIRINIFLTKNISSDDNYFINKSYPVIRTRSNVSDKYATTTKTTNEITIQDIIEIHRKELSITNSLIVTDNGS